MKYKKTILVLSIFIMSFTYIVHPLVKEYVESKEGYKDEIIRFHIRANSDRDEDQELKLKIRDEILKEMGDKFKGTVDLDKSREIIVANMEAMKTITEDVIQREGEDYSVDITLGQDNFPTRKYGNLVYPAGDYETLLITLGEGSGQNWWCVMFPPLCFVDITHSVAYNLENELIERTEKRAELDEQPKLILKSKIVDLIRSFLIPLESPQ